MLISYSSYFVAFLLSKIKNIENIEKIILFGSVARNEADKESDVDIFIELKEKNKKIEKELRIIIENFYESREAALFKSKGIENIFDVKIGILKEWKELYRSIAATGIVLYGNYEAKDLPSDVKRNTIIFWNKIEINRGSFLNKLYGFKIKDKSYQGLLTKYNGKKIGKSSILIPTQYKKEIYNLLREHKVSAKSIDVFI